MKPFKTYEEQIEIIKNRGLIVEDEEYAKEQLALYNYYNIINGYKDLFVINNATENERFIENVRFEELLQLYTFDIKTKQLFLEQILRIESVLKSTIAYVFAKNHPDGDILNKNNYNVNFKKVKANGELIFNTDKVINELGDCIESQLKHKNDMIRHYKETYGQIPMWVAVNIFMLGLTSELFSIMTPKDQSDVCKQLSKLLQIEIFPTDLIAYFNQLVYARNICAHNQRFYDIKTKCHLSTNSKFMVELNLTKQPDKIFSILVIIRNLSKKEEFNQFFIKFMANVSKLQIAITSIDPNIVLKKMGLSNTSWLNLYLI